MEVAGRVRAPLNGGLAWHLYGGPAGEPALGPAAFPHRRSAMPNPVAPIAHHWLDATHIAFGVVTGGLSGRALARGGVGLQRARAGRSASRLRPRAARFLRRPSVAAAPSDARAAGVGGPARSGRAGVRRGPALRHRPRHRLGQLRAPGGRGPPRGGHARLGQQHRAGTAHARRSARRHCWSHPAGHPVRARRAQRETVARAAHSRTALRHPHGRQGSGRLRAPVRPARRRATGVGRRGVGRAGPALYPSSLRRRRNRRRSFRLDPTRVALSGRACPRRSSAAAEAFFQ